MIEFVDGIHNFSSLPFVGCKSGPSKWFEDLSREMMTFKSLYSLESSLQSFEDSKIYELLFPLQKNLLSDRLFEEIYRGKDDTKSSEKAILSGGKKDAVAFTAPDIASLNFSPETNVSSPDLELEKSGLEQMTHGMEKKMFGENGGRAPENSMEKYPTRVLKLDFNEVEKAIPEDEKTKNKLVKEIIYRAGKDIENIDLSGNINAVKAVLDHLNLKSSTSKKAKGTGTQFSRSIESVSVSQELLEKKDSTNIISGDQFSKHVEGISVSRQFLEEKAGVATDIDPDQPEETSLKLTEKHSLNEYFDSPEKLTGKMDSTNISANQFSKHVEGISVSNEFLEEKTGVATDIDSDQPEEISLKLTEKHSLNEYFDSPEKLTGKKDSTNISANQFSKHVEGISVSNEFLGEKARTSLHSRAAYSKNEMSLNAGSSSTQFDKIFNEKINHINRETKGSGKKSESKNTFPRASFNTLLDQAYSNYKNKLIIQENDQKLFLNLTEKINQSINQDFKESTSSNQNIFNIHISGDPTGSDKDLQNLSDRLVLILKEQARRHGIDLS